MGLLWSEPGTCRITNAERIDDHVNVQNAFHCISGFSGRSNHPQGIARATYTFYSRFEFIMNTYAVRVEAPDKN